MKIGKGDIQMLNAVEIIKQNIVMENILCKYGFRTDKRRIPCPLHNGVDDNFEVKEKTYCCHSHCGSGDVIAFVQKLFNLSFTDTLRKIDADFGLNIYGDHTFEELRRSHYKQKAIKAERERKKMEKEQAEKEYWAAFDEWKRLCDNRRIYRPKSPDEEPHPLFVESLQKLSHQEYLVDCLNERRKQYA